MSLKKPEIESIVDHALDETLSEIFENEFRTYEDIEYALEYLRNKVDELEADDFEDCITD
jgi:hypothetical protein